MSLLAVWSAPIDPSAVRFQLNRSASADMSGSVLVVEKDGLDYYDNYITHYIDTSAPSAAWYQVNWLDQSGIVVETTGIEAGEVPLQVTPQHVIDQIQGLPLSGASSKLVQRIIRQIVSLVETRIRMSLSETTETEEPHSGNTLDRIFNRSLSGRGRLIQLNRWPVRANGDGVPDVTKVQYVLRAGGAQKVTLTNLDIRFENHRPSTGMNHGQISVYPNNLTIRQAYSSLGFVDGRVRYDSVQVLFTYKHGIVDWPYDIQKAVTEMAAASLMEIIGEATTAGLSSQSMDGMSESFTASATTTVFSARRLYYEQTFEKIVKQYKQPVWG